MPKIILITSTDTPRSTRTTEKTLYEGKIISEIPHRNIEDIANEVRSNIVETLQKHAPYYQNKNYHNIASWIEDQNRETIINIASKDYNTETTQLTYSWRLKYER